MDKVVTFGELLLRLAPNGYNRFLQCDNYNAVYGGGEANVAVFLANAGVASTFITKLPTHEIGQAGVNSLRKFGVDTSFIARGGSRVGIYFIEKGASERPSKVIYDRADSAFAKALPSEFDWNKILENTTWFHFSGITPALSDEIAAIVLSVLKLAKQKAITVSCDINYRKNLWPVEKASEVMTELMQYVDVLIANEEHAKLLFGVTSNSIGEDGELNEAGYQEIAEKLVDKFGFETVAITMRRSINANRNKFAAMLYSKNRSEEKIAFSNWHDLQIVDRVGSGDSFSGGLIYSLLSNYSYDYAVNFSVAAASLKHSIEGDFSLSSIDEIAQLANGNGTGRIQR